MLQSPVVVLHTYSLQSRISRVRSDLRNMLYRRTAVCKQLLVLHCTYMAGYVFRGHAVSARALVPVQPSCARVSLPVAITVQY